MISPASGLALGRAAVWLVAVAALVFGGYQWGKGSADARYLQTRIKEAAAANRKYQAEVVRGQADAAGFRASYGQLQGQFSQLEEQFNDLRNRVPLVVARKVVRPAGVALASAGGAAGAAAASAPEAPGVVAMEPVLTAGALWVWNTALAGADVPAGACRSADTSDAACAAETGVTLADAWSNHQANAASCALDRLRQQRLIDHLNGRTP